MVLDFSSTSLFETCVFLVSGLLILDLPIPPGADTVLLLFAFEETVQILPGHTVILQGTIGSDALTHDQARLFTHTISTIYWSHRLPDLCAKSLVVCKPPTSTNISQRLVRPFRLDSAGSRVYTSLPAMVLPTAPPVLSALRLLLISRPDDAWWSFFLVWFIRFLTVSIALRTYIVPWGLALAFSRFRVRSVSLRSIRGVYFCQGRNVWNIDRIGFSYHRPSKTQASRLTVVVQGLKLDIAEPPNEPAPPPPTPAVRHRRVPTLADFSPSPIAFRPRKVIYAIYAGLELHLRPLVRASIIFLLGVLIRCHLP